MPQYDPDKMAKLVSELRRAVDRLQILRQLPEKDFTDDPDKVASSKYHFIVAIESCIDMCNHIIARNGYRVPEDYGDTFMVMGEVDAFDNYKFQITNKFQLLKFQKSNHDFSCQAELPIG